MSQAAPNPSPAESLQRRMVTPEGVDLRITLASASERAGAYLIDAMIVLGVMIALTIVCLMAMAATKTREVVVFQILWMLGFFLLRNGWWIVFELGGRAATPGKRMFGLRVAARNGGRITADAILARNAMREIEVFLPLTFLSMQGKGVDGWIAVLGLIWSGIFALFPLFNRDRLRVGDLVAGTWVVRRPQRRLAPDLTEARPIQAQTMVFNDTQLDAYGIKELQVLENVLRQNKQAVLKAVAERIRRKIEWERRADETDWAFLDAYYAAVRGRLEGRLLLGRRRRDKYDKG